MGAVGPALRVSFPRDALPLRYQDTRRRYVTWAFDCGARLVIVSIKKGSRFARTIFLLEHHSSNHPSTPCLGAKTGYFQEKRGLAPLCLGSKRGCSHCQQLTSPVCACAGTDTWMCAQALPLPCTTAAVNIDLPCKVKHTSQAIMKEADGPSGPGAQGGWSLEKCMFTRVAFYQYYSPPHPLPPSLPRSRSPLVSFLPC